jgi:hypothetical protein
MKDHLLSAQGAFGLHDFHWKPMLANTLPRHPEGLLSLLRCKLMAYTIFIRCNAKDNTRIFIAQSLLEINPFPLKGRQRGGQECQKRSPVNLDEDKVSYAKVRNFGKYPVEKRRGTHPTIALIEGVALPVEGNKVFP